MNEYGELSVPEVAKLLRVHPSTIYKLIRQGRFPACHGPNGFDWGIRRSDLEEWMRLGGGNEPIIFVRKVS